MDKFPVFIYLISVCCVKKFKTNSKVFYGDV